MTFGKEAFGFTFRLVEGKCRHCTICRVALLSVRLTVFIKDRFEVSH